MRAVYCSGWCSRICAYVSESSLPAHSSLSAWLRLGLGLGLRLGLGLALLTCPRTTG